MSARNPPLERFKILSQVLSSILMTSDAVAIYQGSQSLLIPRKHYLSHVEELKEGGIPLELCLNLRFERFSEIRN